MKKLLFLLTAAMVAMSVTAAPVDQTTAMRKAKSYLVNELFAGKLMAPAAVEGRDRRCQAESARVLHL